MTNDELLKSNSLDEKTKLGMARFGVKEKSPHIASFIP